MRSLLLFAVALPSLIVCCDSIIVQSGTGGAPPAGTSTTTSSTTTSSTATGTPTGPPTNLPCGVGQPPCPPYEYCEIPGDVCDAQGTCATKPTTCDDDCPGVCGCDGNDYCNECVAKANGTDVVSCNGAMVEYAAAAWPGGLDHIIIMKANYTDNTCWRIYLDAPITGFYSITVPSPWGISSIVPTNDVTDCLDWQAPQQGQNAVPFIGIGSISWQLGSGMFYPCELNIDASVAFEDPPPPNIQINETFAAQNVVVVGGCF